MISPSNTQTIQRPSLSLLLSEPFRAVTELAGYRFAKPDATKPGDGHPVIIFPGLGADGKSVRTLRAHCVALGYDAFDWGQGFNSGPKGDFDDWLHALKPRIVDLLSGHTQPATFIGWSLGGFYARELAKLMAPGVREVITLGTPFNAEADYTNVGWLFRLLNGSSLEYDPELSQRLRTPPPIRTTSIYSRSDGVVSWETCCHHERSDLVNDIEIRGSHLGMSWNRAVLAVIADRLAHQSGNRVSAPGGNQF